MTEQELELKSMGILYSSWARFLSFSLGIILAVIILLLPQIIAKDTSDLNHNFLSVIMLGMSGCFVHGVGFVPRNFVAKYLFSPYVCWPVAMITFYSWIF